MKCIKSMVHRRECHKIVYELYSKYGTHKKTPQNGKNCIQCVVHNGERHKKPVHKHICVFNNTDLRSHYWYNCVFNNINLTSHYWYNCVFNNIDLPSHYLYNCVFNNIDLPSHCWYSCVLNNIDLPSFSLLVQLCTQQN